MITLGRVYSLQQYMFNEKQSNRTQQTDAKLGGKKEMGGIKTRKGDL